MNKSAVIKRILLLIALSFLMFTFGGGLLSLTNPDEVFYAQTANEMVKHNSWMTPYLFDHPQFEKPIFLYWAIRLGIILFGPNSFAARFFPSFFGIIGVVAVYLLGLIGFKDEKKAFLSAIVAMSCGIYIGLSRSVFTDLIFSVFILLSLAAFFWGYSVKPRKTAGIMLFFVFSGLAVLTKGPLGFIIPFLTAFIFLTLKRDPKFLFSSPSLWGLMIFALVSVPWYALMVSKYGNSFIREFFYNDHIRRLLEAEHINNDTWYFYPLSTVACVFPWSLFLLAAFFKLPAYLKARKGDFLVFLIIWIGVVFVIFESAHSKLISYIVPYVPALALLIGNFIAEELKKEGRNRVLPFVSTANVFFIWLMPMAIIFCLIRYPDYIQPTIPVCGLLAVFWAFSIYISLLIRKKRFSRAIPLFALVIPLSLCVIPFMYNNVEPYVSSKRAYEHLSSNYEPKGVILTSKFFVRGVRYYSGKEVAVMDIAGSNFFSPHPIPFLNTDQKVRDFLLSQPVTYCILRKAAYGDLDRIAINGLKYELLKIVGNEYIVKIERL